MKKLKLTADEDSMYGKLMGGNLNLGYSEKEAEQNTVYELKRHFPRLRKLTKKDTKISLEVIAREKKPNLSITITLTIPEAKTIQELRNLTRKLLSEGSAVSLIDYKILNFKFNKGGKK